MSAVNLLRAKQAARAAAANSEAAAKKLAEERDTKLFAYIVEMYEELRKAGVKVRQEAYLAKDPQSILDNKYSSDLPAPSDRLIEVRAVKYPSGYGTEITRDAVGEG